MLQIAGLETNVNFLLDLASHPEFVAGNVHTNFIRDHYDSLFRKEEPSKVQICQAALATVLLDKIVEEQEAASRMDRFNPFVAESNFRVNYQDERDVKLKFGESGKSKNRYLTKIIEKMRGKISK